MRILGLVVWVYLALSLTATLCVADYALYTGPFVAVPHEFLHSIASKIEIISFPAAIAAWLGVWANLTERVPDRLRLRWGDNVKFMVPGIASVIAICLFIYFWVSTNLAYAALIGTLKNSFTDTSLIAAGIYGAGTEALFAILVASLLNFGYQFVGYLRRRRRRTLENRVA